jgi:hypothetical protein
MLMSAALISGALNAQLNTVEAMFGREVRNWPNIPAMAYTYGWTDAFLRARGWDKGDTAVGPPVHFHVLRQLWPFQAAQIGLYLADHLTDSEVLAGMMYGGQQYLDWQNRKINPMGLVRLLHPPEACAPNTAPETETAPSAESPD